MDVGNSVRKAIIDWEDGEPEAAMIHACFAVDGTAKKVFPRYARTKNALRFTSLLRQNYGILGPFGTPGIDLDQTRFPVHVEHPQAPGGQPDLADIVYGIHRCHHGHGEALPDGFQLVPDLATGQPRTRMVCHKGRVQLSDRIIFGLLAVAVLSPMNTDQRVPDGYYLSCFGEDMPINEWWGRADDFSAKAASHPTPLVRLDFTDWMDQEDDPA